MGIPDTSELGTTNRPFKRFRRGVQTGRTPPRAYFFAACGEYVLGVAFEGNVAKEVVGDRFDGLAEIELGTIPGGYGWVFPKGDHVNVGVGGWESEGPALRDHLRVLCRAYGIDEESVEGLRGHYILPWPSGRVVCGATRETGSGLDPSLTLAGCEEVLREAHRLAPGLAQARIVEWRVGLRPLSTRGRPMVGALPGVEHVHVATGHGASGLLLGPYCGLLLAESLATGRPPAELALLAL